MREKQITLAQFINKEPPVFEHTYRLQRTQLQGLCLRVLHMCAYRTCRNQQSMTFMGIVTPLTNDRTAASNSASYNSC